jgi:hypothetical protein
MLYTTTIEKVASDTFMDLKTLDTFSLGKNIKMYNFDFNLFSFRC